MIAEFIGGPLDGERREIADPRPWLEFVAAPEPAVKQPSGPAAAAFPVATYRLVRESYCVLYYKLEGLR